jgi:hypothetical protein
LEFTAVHLDSYNNVFSFNIRLQETKHYCTHLELVNAYSQSVAFAVQPSSKLEALLKRTAGNWKNLRGTKIPRDEFDSTFIRLIENGTYTNLLHITYMTNRDTRGLRACEHLC